MSRRIYTGGDRALEVTAFHGGMDRGRCLQLDTARDYAVLTEDQARDLYAALRAWLDGAEYVGPSTGADESEDGP